MNYDEYDQRVMDASRRKMIDHVRLLPNNSCSTSESLWMVVFNENKSSSKGSLCCSIAVMKLTGTKRLAVAMERNYQFPCNNEL